MIGHALDVGASGVIDCMSGETDNLAPGIRQISRHIPLRVLSSNTEEGSSNRADVLEISGNIRVTRMARFRCNLTSSLFQDGWDERQFASSILENQLHGRSALDELHNTLRGFTTWDKAPSEQKRDVGQQRTHEAVLR